MAKIFDGQGFAQEREEKLREKIADLQLAPRMVSHVFDEDEAGQLYTRLKFEAAVRVGIEFDRRDHSISEPVEQVQKSIVISSERKDVDGVMVQKPTQRVWRERYLKQEVTEFSDWWRLVANSVDSGKDVDCLSQKRQEAVYTGEWQLVPATVKAVLLTLGEALGKDMWEQRTGLSGLVVSVLGRSDIVGRPLAAVLKQFGAQVYLCGSQTEDLEEKMLSSDVVVSATGRAGLVTAESISEGAMVIDVGSPRADVAFEAVAEKAAFITPVPDGIGPVTVVCLLENLVELAGKSF